MPKILRFFSLLIAVSALAALGACQPHTSGAHGASQEGITVTDALGRSLHLAAPPERIVVAGRGSLLIADVLYAFPEAPKRIAAIANRAQSPAAFDFLRLVDPDLDAKLVLEPDAGPEQIAAQHPDLVVMKQFLAGKLGRSVEALGVPVFYVQMETPEQYSRELRQLGVLFGDPQRGEALASFYASEVTKAKAGASAGKRRPRVLILQHTVKGGTTAYKTPPADWIQTTMVTLAGGVPVWSAASQASGWQVVTLEQVAAWKPDQIYIVDYFGDPAQAVAAFRADPAASLLAAVQNGQVYPFPKDFVSWDQPDTRWVLGLIWLAKHLRPDALAGVDVCAEVGAFYRMVYDLGGKALEQATDRCPDY